ncbi:MAG: aminotransferase class I/II-fold pyridoxal phosphate-dependent enzyme [Vampirovibrionales bacterium]|nr:aminotransferase class I/II-fold pyridoxal phosphate-dependent enzyme [Vampirovibrionales bacterium]
MISPLSHLPQCLIQPRLAVAVLQAYKPPLEGRAGRTRLDFNENTEGLNALLPASMRPLADLLKPGIYPEYQALEKGITETFCLPSNDWLLVTNGSDEGLSVVAQTFIEHQRDSALCVKPTFPIIPHSLKLAEAVLVEVPLTPAFCFDVAAIEETLCQQNIKLVMIASPDNPTGAELNLETLTRWLESFPNTLFVIDEAYAGFESGGQSALSLITQFGNLLVLRSFSKVWALAGLRLGLVMGHPHLIQAMQCVRSPYSVNVAAAAMAQILLPQAQAVAHVAQSITARKPAFMQAVEQRGYRVHGGGGNFFMIAAGADLNDLIGHCKAQGVLVRSQNDKPMLAGWLRVSVGTDTENNQFLAALDSFKASRALILDLDDTLVECSHSFTSVVSALYQHYTGEPLDLAKLTALRAEGGFNDDWVTTLALLQRKGLHPLPSLLDITQDGVRRYLTIAPSAEKLLITEPLLTCLAKRFRLMIYTGRHRTEFDPIWAERLAPYFEAILCVDELYAGGQPKPAADGLLMLKTRYNLKGGYYIGNNVDDMRCAVGADFTPMGVTITQPSSVLEAAGAVRTFDSLNNLRDVFLLPDPSII